ncbi:hypothetical protein HDU93_005044, partial [Gonapodya sp. JEL0774]
SRLLVVRGNPIAYLPELVRHWNVSHVFYEKDFTDPYSIRRDAQLKQSLSGVEFVGLTGHTLYDPDELCKVAGGKPPLTMKGFQNAIAKLPERRQPYPPPSSLPPISGISTLPPAISATVVSGPTGDFSLPNLAELGLSDPPEGERSPHKGGETEALQRLDQWMRKETDVAKVSQQREAVERNLSAEQEY